MENTTRAGTAEGWIGLGHGGNLYVLARFSTDVFLQAVTAGAAAMEVAVTVGTVAVVAMVGEVVAMAGVMVETKDTVRLHTWLYS